LAAWNFGVGSCLASLWQSDKARGILAVPDGRYLDIAISFGYPAEEPARAGKSGGRRPLTDVVYWERWGDS
jgi:nitroreductase